MVHPQIPVKRPGAAVAVPAAVVLVLLTGCTDDASHPATTTSTVATTPSPTGTAATAPHTSPTPQTLPGGRPGTPRGGIPEAGAIDRADPDAVGAAFVRLAWTSDTRLDATPMDAGRRAAALAVPALARSLRTASPAAAPGAEWESWRRHHAYTRVQLQPNHDSGAPADTPTDADRSWKVTITPLGDHRWKGTPRTLVVYLALTRSGSTWAVSDLKVAR